MLRRRRRGEGPGSTPDPALPLMSLDEAAHLRGLVRSTLSELGHEPVMHADRAVLDDGTVLGLDTLARTCLSEPRGRAAWPRAVQRHFTRLLSDLPFDGRPLDDEGTLVLRLADVASIDAPGLTFTYASEPIPGLRQTLCVDRPRTVETLSDQALADRTVPVGALVDEGRENLLAMLRRTDARAERLTHEGRSIWAAVGNDVFTASYALVLPDAIRRWRPATDVSAGVLFALPIHHQLAFAPCTDRDAVLDGLHLLPPYAASGHAEGVAPLSPHVFLWLDGEVTQLTHHGADRIEVHPGPYLSALIGDDGPV